MSFYIIRSFFMFINIESLWVVYISIYIEHLEASKYEYHTLADLQKVRTAQIGVSDDLLLGL